MRIVKTRIIQALMVFAIGLGFMAIAVWAYILFEDGYRSDIVTVLSICVFAVLASIGLLWIVTRRARSAN